MGYSDVRETDICEADVVVVGAGSAGAALAARLSEDASRRVLLIEAGQDTAPGEVPADIRNIFPAAYINSDYFWPGLATSFRKGEAPVPFLQPRVMGGGSSVMGMIALRGLPSDFDAWEQMGAPTGVGATCCRPSRPRPTTVTWRDRTVMCAGPISCGGCRAPVGLLTCAASKKC